MREAGTEGTPPEVSHDAPAYTASPWLLPPPQVIDASIGTLPPTAALNQRQARCPGGDPPPPNR